MKRILFIISMIVAAASLTGCDFFRTLAGRPTSADIAAKRAAIELKIETEAAEARLAALRDSVDRADSTLALSTLRIADSRVVLEPQNLNFRYAIVTGYFGMEENVLKHCVLLRADGYDPEVIDCRRDMKMVTAYRSSSIADIYRKYRDLKTKSYFTDDTWVLKTGK